MTRQDVLKLANDGIIRFGLSKANADGTTTPTVRAQRYAAYLLHILCGEELYIRPRKEEKFLCWNIKPLDDDKWPFVDIDWSAYIWHGNQINEIDRAVMTAIFNIYMGAFDNFKNHNMPMSELCKRLNDLWGSEFWACNEKEKDLSVFDAWVNIGKANSQFKANFDSIDRIIMEYSNGRIQSVKMHYAQGFIGKNNDYQRYQTLTLPNAYLPMINTALDVEKWTFPMGIIPELTFPKGHPSFTKVIEAVADNLILPLNISGGWIQHKIDHKNKHKNKSTFIKIYASALKPLMVYVREVLDAHKTITGNHTTDDIASLVADVLELDTNILPPSTISRYYADKETQTLIDLGI